MKTAGIIGGMSWESTAKYYQWLNQGIQRRRGGLHSARVLLTSVDFEPVSQMQKSGDWAKAGQMMATEARKLEAGGADFILLATNTMHQVADDIIAATSIPFIHLADATAASIRARGVTRIGLLGTRYTMERDFYKGRLAEHGLEVIVPDAAQRDSVHAIIFDELCKGIINPASKRVYKDIAQTLVAAGAEGVILGCTEITMLLEQADFEFPVFDTTRIHIETALDLMLED